jgi:hypothetical protein
MRSLFHKLILASAVVAAAALTTNAAMAATTVKVPFSFTVAGKLLPAGNYLVKHDSTGNFVILENRESRQSFTWVLGPGEPQPDGQKIVLKFDAADQTHALESIQYGSMTTARLDSKHKSLSSEQASARASQSR